VFDFPLRPAAVLLKTRGSPSVHYIRQNVSSSAAAAVSTSIVREIFRTPPILFPSVIIIFGSFVFFLGGIGVFKRQNISSRSVGREHSRRQVRTVLSGWRKTAIAVEQRAGAAPSPGRRAPGPVRAQYLSTSPFDAIRRKTEVVLDRVDFVSTFAMRANGEKELCETLPTNVTKRKSNNE